MGAMPTVMRCGRKSVDIGIIGLYGAGKTTILYKYKLGFNEPLYLIHTIGYNLETISYKSINFNVFDPGGGNKLQPLLHANFKHRKALIFVVDSSDDNIHNIREAREDLDSWIASNEVNDVILLIFANKQDVPNAMTVSEIVYRMNLKKLKIKWHIQPSIAITGEGIIDGLEWLYQQVLAT